MARNEIDNVYPTVRIGQADGASIVYAAADDLYAISVVDNFGIQMSTCEVRYVPSIDSTGPLVLENGGDYKHGQRIIVYDDGTSTIWFQGWLQRRSDQLEQQAVMWMANDDRTLLKELPVRGALARDIDGSLRYSAALPTSFNPSGAWNCTGLSIGGTVYPVFTPTAYFAAAYESPDEAFPTDPTSASNPYGLPTNGKPVPWTPRRALEYMHLWLYWQEITGLTRIEGMKGFAAVSLDSDVLAWSSVRGLSGKDPGINNIDPLDKKLQSINVQGDAALGALTRLAATAGTHNLDIEYDSTVFVPFVTPPAGKSLISWKPIGYTAIGDGLNLTLKTNGVAETTNAAGTFQNADIIDFSLDEDSSETSPLVVVEGDVAKVELRLEYDPSDAANSTIVPAWTSAEEQSFLRCILGNVILGGTPGKWAIIPKVNGNASSDSDDFISADGATNDTPRALALSQEAVALARQSYPTVFRAWRLNAVNNLATALERPTDAQGFGYMRASRPLLPQQLQFFTFLASSLGDDRLRSNLPIRVSIEFGNKWYDVPRDTSIRVTAEADGNNLIWLDGLAESVNGTTECVYASDLYKAANLSTSSSTKIQMKKIRVNAATPTDYRTTGTAGESLSWRDNAIVNAFKGVGPLRYLDTPNAFKEHLQYKSYPAANPSYFGGETGNNEEGNYTNGLTRTLPPGSENIHAAYAAQREFARRKNIDRTSTWLRAGIQKSPEAGDWIDYIYLVKNDQIYTNYEIRSSIGTVEWDFNKQQTRVGNVLGEF